MSFLNVALLFGLGAVAIPPIVHLFNRRKFEVVDWAAMQFLQLGPRTRRKIQFEQFWLLILRMALLALVVLALADPRATSRYFGSANGDGPRDFILLIDGSASLDYKHNGATAADAARVWTSDFLRARKPGERVAIYQVKATPVPILANPTADIGQAQASLELLGPAKGSADWPAAIQLALAKAEPNRSRTEILVISDDQRFGWADESTLSKWDLVRRSSNRDMPGSPRIWIVSVAGDRPAQPSNRSLDPIQSSRGIAAANREIAFRTTVHSTGSQLSRKPTEVKLEIDGLPHSVLKPSGEADGAEAIRFSHRFGVGSHLVTLKLDDDELNLDNRQDFALEILPTIPVLIVDGTRNGNSGRADFLRDALAPAKDPTPSFAVKVIAPSEWTNDSFNRDVSGPGTAPRVVVLSNLEKLTPIQQTQVDKYLQSGGSVLVALGEFCDAAAWNRTAFRGGQGFLPARLNRIIGDDSDIGNAPKAFPASFAHAALEAFREAFPGGLQTAYFPKRWLVETEAGTNGNTGTAIARLTDREPWLVERSFGQGRVILATHSFDTWGKSNLVRLPDFVRLSHELMNYLAGTRTADRNLNPGSPIAFTPRPLEPVGPISILGPDGRSKTINPENWPAIPDSSTEPGAYKLTTPSGKVVYYAVRSDSREADLTPCSEADKAKVAEALGGVREYANEAELAELVEGPAASHDFWWLLSVLVLGLLAVEIWYTRKLTNRGEHNLLT